MDPAIFIALLIGAWVVLTAFSMYAESGIFMLFSGITILIAGLFLTIIDRGTYETMLGIVFVGIAMYSMILGGLHIINGDI